MPSAHCSRGTIKILREQEKHTTIPCAPRILLRRNNLDSERTRMTTHSSRTTCKEERTELTWYCGAASEIIKVLHHECKWRTQVQVSPLHFRVLAFYWRGLVWSSYQCWGHQSWKILQAKTWYVEKHYSIAQSTFMALVSTWHWKL